MNIGKPIVAKSKIGKTKPGWAELLIDASDPKEPESRANTAKSNLEGLRDDNVSSKCRKSKTNRFDSRLPTPKQLNIRPSLVMLLANDEKARLDVPEVSKERPKRLKLREGTDNPIVTKLKTNISESKLLTPIANTMSPRCAGPRKNNRGPRYVESHAESPKPRQVELLRSSTEPGAAKSKTEITRSTHATLRKRMVKPKWL